MLEFRLFGVLFVHARSIAERSHKTLMDFVQYERDPATVI
jgi:hypothetical protein